MPRARSRLYRRDDSPYWWAVYTSPTGRTVRQSTGCRDRTAAQEWLTARELERTRSALGLAVSRPVSLLQATSAYLAEREPVWSAGWWAAVEGVIRLELLPALGEARIVSTIRREDAEAWRLAQLGREVHRVHVRRQVSPASVNRAMAALAAFGAWCLERGYHRENPWARHRALPESDAPPPSLDPEVVERVLAELGHWRPVVTLALETGLRRSEIARVRWRDVDEAAGVLWVVSSYGRLTKNRKSRAVPLTERALLAVLAHRPARPDGLVVGRVPDLRRAFTRAARVAGVPRLWLHLWRHVYASRLAEAGASTADLRAAGGWGSSRMVDRYTHSRMDRLRELAEAASSGHARSTRGRGRIRIVQ